MQTRLLAHCSTRSRSTFHQARRVASRPSLCLARPPHAARRRASLHDHRQARSAAGSHGCEPGHRDVLARRRGECRAATRPREAAGARCRARLSLGVQAWATVGDGLQMGGQTRLARSAFRPVGESVVSAAMTTRRRRAAPFSLPRARTYERVTIPHAGVSSLCCVFAPCPTAYLFLSRARARLRRSGKSSVNRSVALRSAARRDENATRRMWNEDRDHRRRSYRRHACEAIRRRRARGRGQQLPWAGDACEPRPIRSATTRKQPRPRTPRGSATWSWLRFRWAVTARCRPMPSRTKS